jgi:hypothetical protein
MTDNPDSQDRRSGGEQPADVPPASPDPTGPPAPEPTGLPAWYGEPMSPVAGYWPSVAKPGVIPLRPLNVGDILGAAIATMRRHPGLMLGVAAVVVTIAQLITLALTFPLLDDINRVIQLDGTTPSSEMSSELWSLVGKSLAVAGIALLLTLISRVFLSGFLTLVVGTAVLGQRQGFGAIWNRVRPRLLPLLGLTLVYPAVLIPAILVAYGIALVAGPLAILVVIAYVIVGLWLLIMFSLATPALVLENAGVWQAFGRSWQLVRGSWWRIFGITLLTGLIAGVTAFAIALPFELSSGFPTVTSTEPVMPPTSYLVASTIGAIIASTITEPFAAAVVALLYTDQRIRREDLGEELARTAGIVPPPSPGAPGTGPPLG